MNLSLSTPSRFSCSLIFVALLVSGCSGSGDNDSVIDNAETTTTSDNQNAVDDADQNQLDNDGSTVSVANPEVNPQVNDSTVTSTDDNTNDSVTDNTNNGLSESNPIVDVPLARMTTQVNFQIMVPVYQSNALQVGLVWGEETLSAAWAGDELWTASQNFQADTEHPLTVTFYDDNGEVVLASYETSYKTGFNDAESFEITADQFNTSQWDDDGDGLSNIEELIAGRDPFSAESGSLEITVSDTAAENFWFTSEAQNIATYYEAELLALALPIDIHEDVFVDNLPQQSDSKTRDIAISIDGNGTYGKSHEIIFGQDAPFRQSSAGTRSQQGNTVEWSGTQIIQGSAVRHNGYIKEEFETSTTISGRELIYKSQGTITRKEARFEDLGNITVYNYDIVLDLDSTDSENTCAVLRGTFSSSFEEQVDVIMLEQTVSRRSTDDNWAWVNNRNEEITNGEALELNQRFYCYFPVN